MAAGRVVIAVALLLPACAGAPPRGPDPAPMELCAETAESRAEDPAVLRRARIEAQRWSNETYGEDCVVCAEFDPDWAEGQVFVHITSPRTEDTLITTSAGVVVRRSDGKLMERMKWHSCYARLRRTGSTVSAP